MTIGENELKIIKMAYYTFSALVGVITNKKWEERKPN
jgi:hypothetical protein